MTKRLRLLHLEIAPVLVEDDGDDLNVLRGNLFTVPGAHIAEFPERWAQDFAKYKAQYEAEAEGAVE